VGEGAVVAEGAGATVGARVGVGMEVRAGARELLMGLRQIWVGSSWKWARSWQG